MALNPAVYEQECLSLSIATTGYCVFDYHFYYHSPKPLASRPDPFYSILFESLKFP